MNNRFMYELLGLTRTREQLRMLQAGALRFKWNFTDGPAQFEAVFLDQKIGTDKYGKYAPLVVTQVLINAKQQQPWNHIFRVREHNGAFSTYSYLADDYASLKAVLGIKGRSGTSMWSPDTFLSHTDNAAFRASLNWPQHQIKYASQLPER